jgi:hypothetical protein
MNRTTSPAFDPTRFPRTYTPSAGWRAFALLSAAFGAFALAGVWYFAIVQDWKGVGAAVGMSCVCLALAALGVVNFLWVWRTRVVLSPSSLEVRSLRTRSVLRSEITEYRVFTHQGVSEVRIRTASDKRLFKFTLAFKTDSAFESWFTGIKNPDVAALDLELKQIANDDRLGTSAASRLENAGRAARVAARLNLIGVLITFWALIYPRPYDLAVALAVALPPLALLLCWRFDGLLTLSDKGNTARGNLVGLMIGPGFALVLRALFDWDLVRPTAPIIAAAIVGIVLGLAAFAVSSDFRKAPGNGLLYFLFLGVYAYGTLTLGNCMLDVSKPQQGVATVIAHRHTTGKGAQAFLSVSRVPADLESSELHVSFDLYRRTGVGDRVCVSEYEGALGWHWIRVADVAVCSA